MAARPARDVSPNLADYQQARAEHRVEVPERANPVVDIVERWADEEPEAVALTVVGEGEVSTQTTTEIVAAAHRVARALLRLGVGKGDRVLTMLPPGAEWYAATLGAIRIGAVPSPTPNQSTGRDIARRLEQLGAVAAIADAAAAERFAEVEVPGELRHRLLLDPAAETAPAGFSRFADPADDDPSVPLPPAPTGREDDLFVYFTSGTVSYAKMVLHRQSYGWGHVGTARYWHDLRPGDLHWTISDTGWAKAAWGALFGQWHERASLLQARLPRPSAEAILGLLEAQGVSSFCAPPTIYRMLVQADLSRYDLTALRHCTSAGEPLNPEVIRAWGEGTGGLTIYDGYGQTETTALVANYRAMEVRPGSMGRPVPGWDVAVHDRDGAVAATGEVGDIAVRADAEEWPIGLFSGYLGEEQATADAIRDGWYYTGDKARVDADGYFWFEGRSDDVITSSAYRIGPFEVESALIEHPAVVEAAVVGKPDPDRTEIVCAFVILAAGVEGDEALVGELQDHVKSTTAPYKYPREIRFVTTLPKTISGKIRRSELRASLREQAQEES